MFKEVYQSEKDKQQKAKHDNRRTQNKIYDHSGAICTHIHKNSILMVLRLFTIDMNLSKNIISLAGIIVYIRPVTFRKINPFKRQTYLIFWYLEPSRLHR